MNIEERNNLFEKFLKNGMSIEEFKFNSTDDKENLFLVYEEYLKSMLSPYKELLVLTNLEKDITIYIDDLEICMFEINYNYTTIKCHTTLTIEDEDLVYCMAMFFLTIKELRSVILTLAEGLAKGMTKMRTKSGSKSQNSDPYKNGKYKTLPKGTKDIINKITSIQDSILKNLSDNKKYEIPKGKDKK